MLILQNDEFQDATCITSVIGFFWPVQIKMAAEDHSSLRDHSSPRDHSSREAWNCLLLCCWLPSSARSQQKSSLGSQPLGVALLCFTEGSWEDCQPGTESLALYWNCPTLRTGGCPPGCQLPVPAGERIGKKGWPCLRMASHSEWVADSGTGGRVSMALHLLDLPRWNCISRRHTIALVQVYHFQYVGWCRCPCAALCQLNRHGEAELAR